MTNTNMRRGFTMIELIFVIVIIGILAAVAIPKLSATRDDAKISKTAANLKTLLNDATSFYTAKGETNFLKANWADATQALDQAQLSTKITTAVKVYGDGTDTCFTVTPVNDANGTRLNVTTTTGNPVCDGADLLAKSTGMTDSSGKATVSLGGARVSY